MSIYPSLEDLKLDEVVKNMTQNQTIHNSENPPPYMAICPPHPSGMDQQSLDALYPVLNDYMGLELSIIAQNNTIANPIQNHQVQVTNGVRKLVLCKDGKGQIGLKLSALNNGVFVSIVAQDSPAAKAGVRFGDQILQINEDFVAGMSVDKVYKIFKECSVNNINVIIRDRPLERTINLYKDRAGQVGFQFKNGKINNIVKNSSAARNGVLTDHQLLEVNGQNIVGMKDKEIVEIIANASDMITITIIPMSIYEQMIKKIAPSLIKNIMDHSSI
ncbi:PDZ domain [Cinara cedri]|uniref:PDZ domain n=1 Tax=Cinara cedri TaxID=506608 RepID=A0A5E4NEE2_9HEMI|nr:PDZ domain [Cinara cedri]